MTTVYEVRTRHSKKVLQDFIAFSVKVNNPTVSFRLAVFGICFFTLAFILRDYSRTAVIVLCLLGVALLGFAIFRKTISFWKLAKVDLDYQQQSEIRFVFGHAEFIVYDAGHPEGVHIKYGEVSQLYGDDKNFYIGILNETLHVLPKSDLVSGSVEKFYDFLQDKTEKPVRPTVIPWKTRLQMMIQYRDEQAELRRAQAEERVQKRKEEKKNKRDKKKNT